MNAKNALLERFIRYVKIDTTADENSTSVPSSTGQIRLADILERELHELGLSDIARKDGVLYARIPARGTKAVPFGLIAHLDTSPELSGGGVVPQIHEQYDGNPIRLSFDTVLSSAEFPELSGYVGQTLITASGATLLGADNKAGVAIIMTAAEEILGADYPVPDIYIAFTSDEEIGKGMDHFDLSLFKAQYAYTIDGGSLGELEYETFNAAKATLSVRGRSVHPGSAKGKMINAARIVTEFASLLPSEQSPEFTDGYDGFFHLTSIAGDVEEAEISYIIRDHNRELFEKKKKIFVSACDMLVLKYGNCFALEMKDQYYNMREKIEPVMAIVDIAADAMKSCGVEPLINPVRGGTDGARLSFMGVPCPNIFTGGHNYHGRYEYISLQSMEKSVRTVSAVARMWKEKFDK